MKNTILLVLFPCYLFCQNSYDINWVHGTHNWPSDEYVGGNIMHFSDTGLVVSEFNMLILLTDIACISDQNGRLVAYTSGCSVIDRSHQIMTNGNNINAGVIHNDYCSEGDYPSAQGLLFLPWLGDTTRYVLIHLWADDATFTTTKVLYSVVNMDTPDSLGEVTIKNQLIFEDEYACYVSAVRHANGRDWWIVVPQYNTSTHFLFLLSPEGISQPTQHTFGEPMISAWALGQTNFSADGSKFIRASPDSPHLLIADFDRCEGTFSNAININFPNDSVYAAGCVTSRSGRYLYMMTSLRILQFDLWADDIEASRQDVAYYDGFLDPWPNRFFQGILAPDDKIYISNINSARHMHIIHSPDVAGLGCNVEQHGLEVPNFYGWQVPNIPNFRLLDVAGTTCDSLDINGPLSASDIKYSQGMTITPNPATASAVIQWQQPVSGTLTVTDFSGREVARYRLQNAASQPLDCAAWPQGVYVVRVHGQAGSYTERLVVQR